MEVIFSIILIGGFAFLTYWLWIRKAPVRTQDLSVSDRELLEKNVKFYRELDDEKKKRFKFRLLQLLSSIKITPIGTEIERLDELFIGASGVIPTFYFNKWTTYPNLDEVLIYPDNFSQDYDLEGADRHVLGMVGWQVMEGKMILSREALRNSFRNNRDAHHVGIHEFAHLLDKMDGSTDGVPEYLLDRNEIAPWLEVIHRTIKEIAAGKSDINSYGATNKAEFFSVVSEYFFERPERMKQKYPELYQYLYEVYFEMKE